ncbi:MAG: hypothetical protein ACOH18_05005 [Candidatus Saccharimonadaceae bacterium]
MIFSNKDVERVQAEKLEELKGESTERLGEIAELHQQNDELVERLAIVESFSGASAELFRQFNDYLNSIVYISLSDEAKAIWYPVFEEALTQLLGQDSAPKISDIIDNSTFSELLDYMADANPTVQATVAMLTDEVFQNARRKAEERVTRLHVVKAEGDAAVQAPVLVERMYAEYTRSPEGQAAYEEAFQRRLGELAIIDPVELAERLRHQAYIDATKEHLDREAARMKRELVIETAREDFFRTGINLSELPVDTEVTIWLGTDQEFNDLHKESIDDADRTMIYYRKIRAFKINDRFDGFDIHEDIIDSPQLGLTKESFDSRRDRDRILELYRGAIRGGGFDEIARKKKKGRDGVSYDDTTSLEGRHLLGSSKKGYADSGRRLERFIVAGKPLGYDGDPRNPEHTSTSLVVLNVAINGEPIVDFEKDAPYSKRGELEKSKGFLGFLGL